MLIDGPITTVCEIDKDDAASLALVGPHAIIHAVAVMNERFDKNTCKEVLAEAQIEHLPSGNEMVPEIEALRLHRWLALREPLACYDIAEEAAKRTADYIIANRIPSFAARLMKALPAAVGAPLLMNSIRKHAWTFIGAGRFKARGAWVFTIDRSKAADPILPPESLYHWYRAVFQQLYKRLVSPRSLCRISPQTPDGYPLREYCITLSEE